MPYPPSNIVDEPRSRPPSRWLRLAHVACVAVALLTIGLFVAGLPLYYEVLRTLCTDSRCQLQDQLTLEQLRQLEANGLSLDIFVAQKIAINVLLAFVCFVVGGILLWYRAANRMALVVAVMLFLLGIFGDPDQLAAANHPILASLHYAGVSRT